MKITYTGRQVELAPAELKKLEARFVKIGVLLDGKKECEVHVVLSLERHLHHAEATINYFNHQLVGMGSNNDLFTAVHASAEKLEKQVLKARTKWRDNFLFTRKATTETETERHVEVEHEPESAKAPGIEERVHRVNHNQKRKPMTLEEAMLQIDKNRDYLVYRDTQTDKVAVLIRRRDGNFDLVEA